MGLVEQPLVSAVLVTLAYLAGSLATAVIVSRAFGLPDPRGAGSGNAGATNVLRLGGKKAAVLTLIGDVLKGWIPVVLAKLLGASTEVTVVVAVAAFLGHLYPIFFGFAGGKGVATALGALTGIAPALGGAVLATWLIVVAITRYSSLSALVAALAAPVLAHLLTQDPVVTVGTAGIALLLIWRHRANISRLVAGEEDKIGSGGKTPPESRSGEAL